jgi:RNA polymerase sigma-70 factor (ECF subfamily)
VRADSVRASLPGSERTLLLVLAVLGAQGHAGRRGRERLWEHHRYLLALLRYKLADDDLAEDLLQETYAAFLRLAPPPDFQSDAKLRNYLVSIAMNKLRDHFRGKDSPARRLDFRSRQEAEAWIDNLPSRDEGVEDRLARDAEDGERRALAALAMESLPEAQRRILELKFTHNLGNMEICQRMGLGIKAVESLLFRAKKAFEAKFVSLARKANGSAPGRVNKGRGRAADEA